MGDAQDALTRFLTNRAGDDPRALFDFVHTAAFWVVVVMIPLAVAALIAAIYLTASLYNRLEARYFRRPGTIVLGQRVGTFKDWLLHHPVTLRREDAYSGIEMVGPPRQGKTEMLKGWGYQYLRAGMTVFVLELSGNLGRELTDLARAMGRPVFVCDPDLLDAAGAEKSLKLSLLSGECYKVTEQATTTFTALSNTSEHFFTEFGANYLRHVVHAVHAYAARTGIEPTLWDCQRFMREEAFRAEVLDLRSVNTKEGSRLVVGAHNLDEHSRGWFRDKFLKWSPRQFEHAEGLDMMFDVLFAKPITRRLLTPEAGEEYLDLGTALNTPGALVVMRFNQAALGNPVSRTLANWGLQIADQETRNRGEHRNPVITLLDELHRTIDKQNPDVVDSFNSWTADVPKHKVGIVGSYQSRGLLGEEITGTVATTLRQKVVLPGLGPEDAADAEAVLGYEDQPMESRTRAEGGLHLPGSRGRPDTVNERQDHLPRVRAEQIRETEPDHAWVRLTVRRKLKPPMLLRTYRAPDVEKVRREFGTQADPPPATLSPDGYGENGHRENGHGENGYREDERAPDWSAGSGSSAGE